MSLSVSYFMRWWKLIDVSCCNPVELSHLGADGREAFEPGDPRCRVGSKGVARGFAISVSSFFL